MAKSTKKLYTGARWQSDGILEGSILGPSFKGKDPNYKPYIDPAIDKLLDDSNFRDTTKKSQTKKSQSPKTSRKSDARPKTKSQSVTQTEYSSHAK